MHTSSDGRHSVLQQYAPGDVHIKGSRSEMVSAFENHAKFIAALKGKSFPHEMFALQNVTVDNVIENFEKMRVAKLNPETGTSQAEVDRIQKFERSAKLRVFTKI